MSSADALLRLIKSTATIRQVQSFLQSQNLPFSAASWDELIDTRILPVLGRRITEADLLSVLRESEEFGRQHVFIFRRRGKKGQVLPTMADIAAWVGGTPDADLLKAPRVLEFPEEPTYADVRFEDESLVLKVVETRTLVEYLGEEDLPGGYFTRRYRRTPTRAVDMIRLHSDGLLELRVYSHRGQGGRYQDELDMLWGMLAGLLEEDQFDPISLMVSKQNLWQQRHARRRRIRFSKATLRDINGTVMDCSTGSVDAHLFDDEAAEAGLSAFHSRGQALCDRHNVWWLRQPNGSPSRDVHVLLSGMDNEFAVTMQCAREDYEHILSEIRVLNR